MDKADRCPCAKCGQPDDYTHMLVINQKLYDYTCGLELLQAEDNNES